MIVNWRKIRWARNSFAVLYAACEKEGIILRETDGPENDITLYSLNSVDAPHYMDEIRDAECITIVGGPHPSALPGEMAEVADYVVVGEGEYVLPKLLKTIMSDPNHPAMRPLPGVATKNGFIPNDRCVLLDYYPPFTQAKSAVEISRGCPFRCGYCQTPRLFGGCMRHRSVDEIVNASKIYTDVRFLTPNALAYGSNGREFLPEKVEKLLSSFSKDQNLYLGTFPSEVRPEFINDEAIDLIDKYCANKKIHFGAQSGSERVLSFLHRGHTCGDVIRAVELCHERGFAPVVDYIVGIPFETEEDQIATVEQMRWLSRFGKIHAHYFTPLPGTPLAGTEPSELIPEVNALLGKLSLSGKVTGHWHDAKSRFFGKKQASGDS
ncbi:TIGR04013 family B12-binding domain/radical SAM domain-containing protein [Methanolacinia paynteri]|uniref:TIGR04013 family B12-binding domain/radical SAM domain-containing protein n=1 Tax=Methanolacinia paynteri TaxID=230356 RepID=UPI00064FD0C0|nr:TIGR04013 family B12-binding domain/radical SAM domain-containing protein [Methanolacinia paynteri]